MVDDELRVSGLDGATSLIQNAKNLLNAVILTVKSAFIASTKYRRKESTHPRNIEWKMAAPQRQRGGPMSNGDLKNGGSANGRIEMGTSVPDFNCFGNGNNGNMGNGRSNQGIIRRVSERKPNYSNGRGDSQTSGKMPPPPPPQRYN